MGISSTHRRRIVPNPPAAVIREREYRHGPWMKRTNRRIEVETSKAEAVIFEKRIFDLAKQAVASLQGDTYMDCVDLSRRAHICRNCRTVRSRPYILK